MKSREEEEENGKKIFLHFLACIGQRSCLLAQPTQTTSTIFQLIFDCVEKLSFVSLSLSVSQDEKLVCFTPEEFIFFYQPRNDVVMR